MHILYVGNGNYKHRGGRYYEPGRKLMNGFIREGHNVYFISDRDTARAATIFGSLKLGRRHCNAVFLDTCRKFTPELILLGHADLITGESLQKARQLLPEVKIAQFNVDAIFNPHTVAQIAAVVPFCDATFVTTAGPALQKFSRPGSSVAYIPNPVDSSMEWPRCFERSDQPHDVFWALRATQGSYPGDSRIEFPLFLEKNGIAIDYHGMNGKPELMGAAYYRGIANARMGLNISSVRYRGGPPRASEEDLYLYASDRISHYLGSGLLTFTTRDNRLEELFEEDRELVFFSSKEELLDKVRYYRQHDEARRAIARAGWEKAHRHFNERLVARYMIEITFRQPLSESYAWPAQTY
jgi:hypothetical protein